MESRFQFFGKSLWIVELGGAQQHVLLEVVVVELAFQQIFFPPLEGKNLLSHTVQKDTLEPHLGLRGRRVVTERKLSRRVALKVSLHRSVVSLLGTLYSLEEGTRGADGGSEARLSSTEKQHSSAWNKQINIVEKSTATCSRGTLGNIEGSWEASCIPFNSRFSGRAYRKDVASRNPMGFPGETGERGGKHIYEHDFTATRPHTVGDALA